MKDEKKQKSTVELHNSDFEPKKSKRKKIRMLFSGFFVTFRIVRVFILSILVSLSVVACDEISNIIPPVDEPCTCELCDDDCEDCTCGEHECIGEGCTHCADCDCGCNGSTE